MIAHRGASGYHVEHTLAAYTLAVAMGAHAIEPDLVSTRDGVLVVRHDVEISATTDVGSRPEFADRATTKMVDGHESTGWFTDDFDLAELTTLRAVERLPALRGHPDPPAEESGVLTFAQVLALREWLCEKYERPVGIVPEIKHPTYFRRRGVDQARAVIELLDRYGLAVASAPVALQCFELGTLLRLREELGYRGELMFLTTATGAPYDLVLAGEPTRYADLTSRAGLERLAAAGIDGIGPDKDQVIPRRPDGRLGAPTSLVQDAHAAGLSVTPWTFRNENAFLPLDYRVGPDPAGHGRAAAEVLAYLHVGVDGFFTDHPDTGVAAREAVRAG